MTKKTAMPYSRTQLVQQHTISTVLKMNARYFYITKPLYPEQCSIGKLHENIVRYLTEVTPELIGTKETNANKKYWSNEEIELLVQEKTQKYPKWLPAKMNKNLEVALN